MSTFTCAACGVTYGKDWSDQEAADEYAEVFSDYPPDVATEVVCDDCYEQLLAWGGRSR